MVRGRKRCHLKFYKCSNDAREVIFVAVSAGDRGCTPAGSGTGPGGKGRPFAVASQGSPRVSREGLIPEAFHRERCMCGWSVGAATASSAVEQDTVARLDVLGQSFTAIRRGRTEVRPRGRIAGSRAGRRRHWLTRESR